MGALISIIQLLGPAILRGAEAGTLVEIAETAAHLIALIRPLLVDPQTTATIDDIAAAVAEATNLRPAQPEDPVFARQGALRPGGR